jgi:hypothetical protein
VEIGWGAGPALNQLRNSGRIGAMDTLSDNFEIKTPKALDEWVLKNHVTLGQTLKINYQI